MSNPSPFQVSLTLYDNDTTTKKFEHQLKNFMSDYSFETFETLSEAKQKNQPMIALVNGETDNLEAKLNEIKEQIGSYYLQKIVVTVHTHDDFHQTSFDKKGLHNFNIVDMIFKEGDKQWDRKGKNYKARSRIRKLLNNKDPKKVLYFDAEDGGTTKQFIEALKSFLTEYEFYNLRYGHNAKNKYLPVFAIIRHHSPRFEDYLASILRQLSEDNEVNLERVSVIYFYSDNIESKTRSDILKMSSSEDKQYSIHQIVLMDFVGHSLNNESFMGFLNKPKEINVRARQALAPCYIADQLRKEDFVAVYFADKSPAADQFIQELRNEIKCLQQPHSINDVTTVDSPTIVYSTKPLKQEQESKIETYKCNVIFILINEGDEDHTLPEKDTESFGLFLKVAYKNGVFTAVIRFLKEIEQFLQCKK